MEDNHDYVISSSLAVLGARKAKLNVYQTNFGNKPDKEASCDGASATSSSKAGQKKTKKKRKAATSRNAGKKATGQRKRAAVACRTNQKRVTGRKAVTVKNKQRLYCICQMPYNENDDRVMLACDFCNDWFHFDCVGLTPREVKMLGKYKCDGCTEAEEKARQEKEEEERRAKTAKRSREQCQKRGCKQRARIESKYCSDECGLEVANVVLDRRRIERREEDMELRIVLCRALMNQWKRLSLDYSDAVAEDVAKVIQSTPLLEEPRELSLLVSQVNVRRLCNMRQNQDFVQLMKAEQEIEKAKKLFRQREDEKQAVEELIERAQREPIISEQLISDDEGSADEGEEFEERKKREAGAVEHMDCVLCGHPITVRQYRRHVEQCFVRKELRFLQTDFYSYDGNSMSARQEADRWRCNVFDKKTRKHCMKLAASCTLHIPEARRKQSMVCGCPVMSLLAKEGPGNGELTEAPTHVSRSSAYLYDNSGGLFPDMDSRLFPVCEQPRSECQRHIGWERLFRAHSLQLCMRQKVRLEHMEDEAHTIRGRILMRAGLALVNGAAVLIDEEENCDGDNMNCGDN